MAALTLQAYLKTVYAQGVNKLVPDSTPLLKLLTFNNEMQQGLNMTVACQLGTEQGFSSGRGTVAFNGAIPHLSADAVINGWGLYLQIQINYDAIMNAQDQKAAFDKWNSKNLLPAIFSFRKRQETMSMYGQCGLGVVQTAAAGVITFTPGSFAPGIWAGSEQTVLEAFTAVTGGSQHNGDLVISAVNIPARQITVTGTSAAVVAGDVIFYKAFRGVEQVGLMAIANNTGSLYGIDASVYGLWAANAYDAGTSGLTLGKIFGAAALSASKGADGMLTCIVPAKAYAALNSNESSLRVYGDAAAKSATAENGFESLVFHSSTGKIEIIPSIFVKEGEAILFPKEYTYRCGSTDLTSKLKSNGEEFTEIELPTSSVKEMRWMSYETVFCEKPGQITVIRRSDGGAL